MEPNTLYKTVGAVVLGLLGLLLIGFWSAIGGAIIGYFAGPPLAKKFLNAR